MSDTETGAERYLTERREDPDYNEAYEKAYDEMTSDGTDNGAATPRKKALPWRATISDTQTLSIIDDHVKTKGYAPSFREVGALLGLRSSSTVFLVLHDLRDRGLVSFVDAIPRSLQVTFKGHSEMLRASLDPHLDASSD